MPPPSIITPKRRVGRPRKQSSPDNVPEDPRAAITAAAAELFGMRGIGAVSMQEIAAASGLGTSSLYYWFNKKELIVAELLQQVNRLPLAHAERLAKERVPADVQLYELVRFDVRMICDFPLEIPEVHRFSAKDRAAFATYWREREQLAATFEGIITRGVSSGAFRKVDPKLCAITIIAQDESVQHWRMPGLDAAARPNGRSEVASPRLQYSHDHVSDFVATLTLAGLLADSTRLPAIKLRARAK